MTTHNAAQTACPYGAECKYDPCPYGSHSGKPKAEKWSDAKVDAGTGDDRAVVIEDFEATKPSPKRK